MSNRLNKKLCKTLRGSLIGWGGSSKTRMPKFFLIWLRRERLLISYAAYKSWRHRRGWKELVEDFRELEDMLDEALFGDETFTECEAFAFQRHFIAAQSGFLRRLRSRKKRGLAYVE